MLKPNFNQAVLLFFAVAWNHPLWAAESLSRIELTCVDERATGYGTFQSHNQKVLANSGGIFMSHIRSRNEPYTAQQWRLSRSTDGGRTFTTVYEATHATNPAVIETDGAANVYLVRPDFADGHSYLYFFEAAKEFQNPRITPIPASSGGKYAAAYDSARKQLYYFSNNNTFHVIAPDGAVKRSAALMNAGPHAVLQYPMLYVDAESVLHAAWTTSVADKYLYWDIHYMKSTDGGVTWQNMDGTPLAPPFASDDTGPSDRISLDDEFDSHTWLSSFLVRGGKAHFLYLGQTAPPRQHFVRYDLATARREIDTAPRFQGDKIQLTGLDGFFAATKDTLYCVSHTPDNHVGCLASSDNGATWRDHALSDDAMDGLYAVGGCRDVTPDGKIIGSFTVTQSTAANATSASNVYFFQIRAAKSKQ
jgi:hypothetical protein